MNTEKKKQIYKLCDIVKKYTNDEEAYMTIVCGIKDEDINEFIDFVNINSDSIRDLSDLLETFITFRTLKGYKWDDVEEEK